MAIRYEDLTGKRFGKLTVLGRNYEKTNGKRNWDCVCDCGNLRVVSTGLLNNGSVRKCSLCCKKAQSENAIRVSKNKHGMVNSKLWKIWYGMRARCRNPKINGYKNYGGRGIKVCEEWDKSFVSFMEWANKNGYKEGLSIDRIDPNGNYEPSNCRWVTRLEQANNKRTSFFVSYNGETHTISEWSRITGINQNTLQSRIKRYGWSVERAICTIPKTGGHYGENL